MKIEDITLQDIYEFMEHGSVENAPEDIVIYLNLLDKARGMQNRIDKFGSDESIIKHFMLTDGLSRYQAKKINDEAKEYFHKDKIISNQAWCNIYADKAEKALNFAMLTMKDVKDAVAVIKAIKEIKEIRGANNEEKENIPEELFQKQVKLYSLDASIDEFNSPANRTKLAKLIDSLPELTEKEKNRIKEESLLPGYKLKIFPDVTQNPRKS